MTAPMAPIPGIAADTTARIVSGAALSVPQIQIYKDIPILVQFFLLLKKEDKINGNGKEDKTYHRPDNTTRDDNEETPSVSDMWVGRCDTHGVP